MKYLISVLSALVICGCATNADVTTKLTMTLQQATAVSYIKDKVVSDCSSVSYSDASQTQVTNSVPLAGEVVVVRLFEASGGWYRALVSARGVMDNVFYNADSRRTVCGQVNWDKFANTAGIVFTEVGVKQRPSLY